MKLPEKLLIPKFGGFQSPYGLLFMIIWKMKWNPNSITILTYDLYPNILFFPFAVAKCKSELFETHGKRITW